MISLFSSGLMVLAKRLRMWEVVEADMRTWIRGSIMVFAWVGRREGRQKKGIGVVIQDTIHF